MQMEPSDFELSHQSTNVSSRIVASLERISHAFRLLLWQQSREHALNPIQVQVLVFLLYHSEEKRRVSYIASEFGFSKATISDTIKSLERKNLIAKNYSPADNRSFSIELTEKGREIAYKTSLFTRELRQPIDRLSPAEKEVILSALLQIIAELNKAGIVTVRRMCQYCSHYSAPESGGHYCGLMKRPLHVTELKIDCPEHLPK